MLEIMKRLVVEEEGQAMTEYGLLVALIAIAAIAGVVAVGEDLLALFEDVASRLTP